MQANCEQPDNFLLTIALTNSYGSLALVGADDVLRARVRQAIATQSISQRELARRLGKSSAWANMWLNGKRSIPLKRADAVAALFQQSLAELLSDAPYDSLDTRGTGSLGQTDTESAGLPSPRSKPDVVAAPTQARLLKRITSLQAVVAELVNAAGVTAASARDSARRAGVTFEDRPTRGKAAARRRVGRAGR